MINIHEQDGCVRVTIYRRVLGIPFVELDTIFEKPADGDWRQIIRRRAIAELQENERIRIHRKFSGKVSFKSPATVAFGQWAIVVVVLLLTATVGGIATYSASHKAEGEQAHGSGYVPEPEIKPMTNDQMREWLEKPGFSCEKRRVSVFNWAAARSEYGGTAKAVMYLDAFGHTKNASCKAMKSYLHSLNPDQAAGAARLGAKTYGRSPDEMESMFWRILNDER